MGYIRFFEGNRGDQNVVIELSDDPGQSVNLKKYSGKNDEARSVRLFNARVGTLIRVYDHPKGKLDDDWCQIEVIGKQDEYTVDSFEHSYADSVVRVTFHRNNGLDGKVSMIRVD